MACTNVVFDQDRYGSTAGIAYVGTVCTVYSVGIVTHREQVSTEIVVATHEIAHIFGADHVAGTSYVMSEDVTYARLSMTTATVSTIQETSESLSCAGENATISGTIPKIYIEPDWDQIWKHTINIFCLFIVGMALSLIS